MVYVRRVNADGICKARPDRWQLAAKAWALHRHDKKVRLSAVLRDVTELVRTAFSHSTLQRFLRNIFRDGFALLCVYADGVRHAGTHCRQSSTETCTLSRHHENIG